MKRLFLIPILLIALACVQEKQQDKTYLMFKVSDSIYQQLEFPQCLHAAVIDLRVPGKWRDAGELFVQVYPHAKGQIIDSLFANLLPENQIDLSQYGRNEPILWVLAMLDQNYGQDFRIRIGVENGNYNRLIDLRKSKEYAANRSFAAHVEKLLK